MTGASTIEGFLAAWIAAFDSHDLDRHMALYAEDATLFGSVDALQVGRDAIRRYFAGRPPGIRVKAYPMPLVRELGADIVLTAGHVDFIDGNTPSPYRMTWVLVRQAGHWRIQQHHGSPRFGI